MAKKHRKYFKTKKGRKALLRARKKYDKKDPEKRRKQKREYMRRRREREKMLELKKTE
jgi:hypothetical protein